MKRNSIRCPYCGARAHLWPAWVVHGARTRDPTEKLYVCARYPFCDSYVSAHRDTLLPMGTLAGPELRRKRIEAHNALDRLMVSSAMTRKEAYRWLQRLMNLSEEEAHIAQFTEPQCQMVIDLCDAFSRAYDQAA